MPEAAKKKDEEQDTLATIIEAIDSQESDPDRHVSIQLDRSIREAVKAAQTSGKPASVSFKLNVKTGPEKRVSFSADVTAKLPRPPVSGVTLYADAEGNVLKSDPRQTKFPFNQQQTTTSKDN